MLYTHTHNTPHPIPPNTQATWTLQGSLLSQTTSLALYTTLLTHLDTLSASMGIHKGLAAMHQALEASLSGGMQGGGGGDGGGAVGAA